MWVACKIYPLYLCKCLYMTGNSIEKKSTITAAALRLQHIKCFVCCEKKLCIKRVCKGNFFGNTVYHFLTVIPDEDKLTV